MVIFEVGLNAFYILTLSDTNGGQRVECGDKDSNDSLRPMFEYVVPHRWHYLGKIRRYGAVEEGMSLGTDFEVSKVVSFLRVLSLSPS